MKEVFDGNGLRHRVIFRRTYETTAAQFGHERSST